MGEKRVLVIEGVPVVVDVEELSRKLARDESAGKRRFTKGEIKEAKLVYERFYGKVPNRTNFNNFLEFLRNTGSTPKDVESAIDVYKGIRGRKPEHVGEILELWRETGAGMLAQLGSLGVPLAPSVRIRKEKPPWLQVEGSGRGREK
jgi:hypothetical protein